MPVYNYDPKAVAVVFNATLIKGFADGDFVSVSYESDKWEHTSGADGEEIRTKSNDNRATLTLTLMQSSASNAVLSAAYLLDEAGNAGAFPIAITDTTGTSLVTGESAWIKKLPDFNRGKSATTVEWMISIANAKVFIGGNDTI